MLLCLTLAFAIITAQQAKNANNQLLQANQHLINISTQQKKDLDTTQKDIKNLKSTLLCIGTFFNSTNRTNLKIDSYEPCIIKDISTGKSIVISTQTESGGQQNTSLAPQAPSQTGQNLRTSPAQNTQNQQNVQPNILQKTTSGIMNTVRSVTNFIRRVL